jgi:hypothetical protein
MMPDGWPGLACALVSAIGIAILAMIDPKRRRASRGTASSTTRWSLLFAILLPGTALGMAGRWTDFLIWIGAAAVFGWAIAALSNLRRRRM